MFQLTFYVPETHVESVKQALFAVGVGTVGRYECCAWQTLGQGQFRPVRGSSPYLGCEGQLECVPEYKVDMVLDEALIESAVLALKAAHPYEVPAYSLIELYRPL